MAPTKEILEEKPKGKSFNLRMSAEESDMLDDLVGEEEILRSLNAMVLLLIRRAHAARWPNAKGKGE